MAFFEIDKEFDDLRKLMRKMLDSDWKPERESRKLKGEWDVKEIDESGVKGSVIEGRDVSNQPLNGSESFEPFSPSPIKRPLPQRPVRIAERTSETREPLTDVFEEKEAVKVYVELPGQEKERAPSELVS